MPVVISDTSPLRALAHLGHLEWLQELFRQVCLPPAVAAELRHPPSSLAVDLAVESGVTLVGFSRDERATVYAHPERIHD